MNAQDQALLALTDAELIEAADLTDAEFDELENQLALRAACLGWTGDPMRQPLEVVAVIGRGIISKRSEAFPKALRHGLACKSARPLYHSTPWTTSAECTPL